MYGALSNLGEAADAAFLAHTRFTKPQFDELVRVLAPLVRRNRRVRHGVQPGGQIRSTKSTMQNRILLTLTFLVVGGSCASLGRDFGIDPHVVSEHIMHVTNAIVEGLKHEVRFPSEEDIHTLIGTYGPNFPDVIGVVDCTYTPTFRHAGDWSGHRHQFLRSHQVAADAFGFITHVVAGQPGGRTRSPPFRAVRSW